MFSFILSFPLFCSLIVGVCGRVFGVTGSSFLSSVGLFMNFVLTLCLLFVLVASQLMFYSQFSSWISLSGLLIDWTFCFDAVGVVMFLVVNSVSCVVHFFSASYMSADPHVARFMSYISFFTLFMLLLVSGDNLMQVFLGWEGVGLCSYLLISFWYTSVDAISSGVNALIVNRVSDFFFLCSLFFLSFVFCSLDFSIILSVMELFIFNSFLITHSFFINALLVCCVFLLGGAMGKSAQILLHTWLPDAMEG